MFIKGVSKLADYAPMRAVLPAAAAALPLPAPLAALVGRGGGVLDGATLLLRRRNPVAKAALEHLLATGGTSQPWSLGGGISGSLPVYTLGGAHGAQAVFKSPRVGAAKEILTYQVASAVGIDWGVPVVARRRDGSAAIELLAGKVPQLEGVKHPNDIDRVLRSWYRMQYPEMPAREVVTRARRDRQLLQTFDYLLNMLDRNSKNAIVNRAAGTVQLIDNASSAARPHLEFQSYSRYHWLQGGSGFVRDDIALVAPRSKVIMSTYGKDWAQGQVTLEAGARQVLASSDRTALAKAFRQYERATGDRQLRRSFLRRLDHVVETGGFRLGGDPVLPTRVSGP